MLIDRKKNMFLNIMILILLLVNIPPAAIIFFPIVKDIYYLLQIGVSFVVFLIYLKNSKISKIIILVCLFYCIYILSTFLNTGDIKPILLVFISGFSLCAGTELFLRNYSGNYIKIARFYFEMLIYVNFITIILFPNGLYETMNSNPHYFLGHRNNSIEYILPTCFFVLIDNYLNKKNNKSIILLIVSMATIIMTWSANAVVALSLVYLYTIFPTKKIVSKIIDFKAFFITSIVMCVMFVIFRLQYLFSWIILNVLNKSLDFTKRTMIWDRSLQYIYDNPIIGYGYEYSEMKRYKIGHPNSAHNYYLDFLYTGGIMMLGVFFTMMYVIEKSLKKCEDNTLKNIFTGICAGYFFVGFATPVHRESISIMFLIFTIIYNFRYVMPNLKKVVIEDNNE